MKNYLFVLLLISFAYSDAFLGLQFSDGAKYAIRNDSFRLVCTNSVDASNSNTRFIRDGMLICTVRAGDCGQASLDIRRYTCGCDNGRDRYLKIYKVDLIDQAMWTCDYLGMSSPSVELLVYYYGPRQTTTMSAKPVSLGFQCGNNSIVLGICKDEHTVCVGPHGGQRYCVCDKNHVIVDSKCEKIPGNLFHNKEYTVIIQANIEVQKSFNIQLNIHKKLSPKFEIHTVPIIRNVHQPTINDGNLILKFTNTRTLQSQLFMVQVAADFDNFRVTDSILVSLEINLNATSEYGSVLEGSSDGEFITKFSVEGYKDYEFVNCNEFRWNKNDILTNGLLDREKQDSYVCKIKATLIDEKSCILKDIGFMTITILDENDNPPIFPEHVYEGTILENKPSGSVVIFNVNITSTDDDIPPNTNISYSLLGYSNTSFTVQQTNSRDVILTIGEGVNLDREDRDSYNFIIVASDGQNTATASVRITILDVNEPPRFMNETYSYSVLEDATNVFVGNVLAEDKDLNEYGRVIYSIKSGAFDYFKIENNGSIYLVNAEGTKHNKEYKLVVSASDDDTYKVTATTVVTVRIEDVNELPIFNQTSFDFSVFEGNSCDQSIGNVYAYDVDYGDNAKLEYHLQHEGDSLFVIDSISGSIKCKASLDFETVLHRSNTFKVMVIDGGNSSLNATVNVTINVLDQNDNSPRFPDADSIIYVLSQNLKPDKLITFIKVEDLDSGENGEVEFSIIKGNEAGVFKISKIGLVSVVKEAAENISSYILEIKSSDKGSNPRSNTTELTINIVNHKLQPELFFTNNTFVRDITEDVSYQNHDLIILGGDLVVSPLGDSLNYILKDEDTEKRFTLTENGTLKVSGKFDREAKHVYSLIVEVKGTPSRENDIGLVTVHVVDINDNTPLFNKSASVTIRDIDENCDRGTYLTMVTAVDSDIGTNAIIEYSIVDENMPFSINKTNGIIVTSDDIDAEKNQTYLLNIKASDGNASDTMEITIHVIDENDNAPHFITKSINVFENKPQNITIGRIYASDSDVTNDGILFALHEDNKDCPVDILQGGSLAEILLKNTLDYETMKTHTCVIIAYDNPFDIKKRLSTTATLTIMVKDTNDNSPVFIDLMNETKVDIGRKGGMVIIDKLQARDDDSGSNGQVNFFIKNQSTISNGAFQIDVNNGSIKTINNRISKQDSSIIITVIARDSGKPPRETEATITVVIVDNTSRPVFEEMVHALKIDENDVYYINNTIYTVKAWSIKHDIKTECDCVYKFVKSESNNDFLIDKNNGSITLVKSLDREKVGSQFLLLVSAETNGNSAAISTVTLTVSVSDVNDNKPECIPTSTFNFNISQSISTNMVVGRVEAIDKDQLVILSYTNKNIDDHFLMDESNGYIYVKTEFNHSRENKAYNFSTQVDDQNSNHTVTCQVNILVLYDNPHPPKFTQGVYQTTMEIHAKKDYVLKLDNFTAIDNDGDNITYRFDSHSNKSVFTIDEISGQIRLKADLKEDIQSKINLKVLATDEVQSPKTGTCTVEITVDGQLCIVRSSYDEVVQEADLSFIFKILFASMVAVLSVAVILIVIICYKWRVSNRQKRMFETYYASMARNQSVNLSDVSPLVSTLKNYTSAENGTMDSRCQSMDQFNRYNYVNNLPSETSKSADSSQEYFNLTRINPGYESGSLVEKLKKQPAAIPTTLHATPVGMNSNSSEPEIDYD